jgi:hypothetical protein
MIFLQQRGLVLIGMLLVVFVILCVAIPQKVPYQSITKVFLAHYLTGRGIGYMQLEQSPILYIVNEGEFLPAFSADYLTHGNVLISFLYRTDETTNIDVTSDNNVHLFGQAYPVERITLYHQYGQQPEIFSTHEYFQNPSGYYQHNWIAGIALCVFGILFIGLEYYITVVRVRKRKQLDFDDTTKPVKEALSQNK